MSAPLLWPRHEVLQLVLPQLVRCGSKTMLTVVRQLSLQQTPSGQITYDKWLIVGKDLLKWNDYSLQLFWDMLLLALSYTSEEHQRLPHLGGGEVTVDLPSLAIFLVLHATDTPSSKVPCAGWPAWTLPRRPSHTHTTTTSPYTLQHYYCTAGDRRQQL